MGDYESAEKYLAESRKIFTRLTSNYPCRLSFKRGLSELMYTMGAMYYYQCLGAEDHEESERYSRRASEALQEHISLVRELRELDSSNLSYLLMECRALEQVANLLLLKGDVNEAESYMRTVLDNMELLLSKEPYNSDYIATQASALCGLALAHHGMPRHITKAVQELAESRRLLEEQIARVKTPPEILLSTQTEVLAHSASVALARGEIHQSLLWLEQAEKQLHELMHNDAPTPRQAVYLTYIRRLIKLARAARPDLPDK